MNERVCRGCPHRKTRACVSVCDEDIALEAFASRCPVRWRDERIEELEDAAREVVDNWESGDLAGAVTALGMLLEGDDEEEEEEL